MRLELHYAGQSRVICFHSQDAAKLLIYNYLGLTRLPQSWYRHTPCICFPFFCREKICLNIAKVFHNSTSLAPSSSSQGVVHAPLFYVGWPQTRRNLPHLLYHSHYFAESAYKYFRAMRSLGRQRQRNVQFRARFKILLNNKI